jgi:hypothetical protein
MRRLDAITAMLIMLLAVASRSEANLVTNPGFEIAENTNDGSLPDTFGDWLGDISDIVTAENGITPFEGSRMLHFIGTSLAGGINGGDSSVIQLVDLSAFSAAISAGSATASASARFNRVAGNAQTDTEFHLRLYPFSGDPSAFPTAFPLDGFLAEARTSLVTDGDPSTWELLSVSLLLPLATTYIAVVPTAIENVFNNNPLPPDSQTEFDGHYADAVVLNVTVVPHPATLLMLGPSVAGLGARAWLRRRSN